MGYVVDAPMDLGGTLAINISDPNNPLTTAVIQAGETGGVVTVNQNKTVPAGEPESTDGGEGASASGGSDGVGPVTIDGDVVTIDWDALPSEPYFAFTDGADAFYQIHTNPETDGFYLNFEFYTVWGEAWTGELGTFPISCIDPTTSTGICVYYDPDGPGPEPVKGSDFMDHRRGRDLCTRRHLRRVRQLTAVQRRYDVRLVHDDGVMRPIN